MRSLEREPLLEVEVEEVEVDEEEVEETNPEMVKEERKNKEIPLPREVVEASPENKWSLMISQP